jgi:hypothetical protein
MPRSAALDDATKVGRGADAVAPTLPPAERVVTHVAAGIQRAEFAQTPQPSDSERPERIGVQPTDPGPAIESSVEPPFIPRPVDERTPAAMATELVVATEPAGARVTVDGIGWGVTPVTIRHLPPGSKRIRVSKDGYAATERVVSVVEGQRKTADISLSNQP